VTTTARSSAPAAQRSGGVAADVRTSLRALFGRPLTPYYLVLGATSLLTVMGLVMVLSASSVIAYVEDGSSFAIAQKQAMWLVIGLPLLFLASRMSTRSMRVLALPALAVVLVLLDRGRFDVADPALRSRQARDRRVGG